jgi:hypothetical protein
MYRTTIDCIDIGNMHLLDLAKEVKKSVEETGQANPFIFNTIGISDAISMGTDGMRSSLPSRDLIADSIECVVRGQLYDANISLVLDTLTLLTSSLGVTKIWYYNNESANSSLDVSWRWADSIVLQSWSMVEQLLLVIQLYSTLLRSSTSQQRLKPMAPTSKEI